MIKYLPLLALLVPVCGYGQAFRVDPSPATTVSSNVPPGAYPPVLAIPGATISFAGGTTYTDLTGVTACPSIKPVVIQGTSVCVSTADSEGNFGFYLKAGNYTYTITTSTGGSSGPLTLSVPTGGGGGGGGCTPGGPNGSLQFNNGSGGCSGVSNLIWDNADTLLSVTSAGSASPGIDVTVGFVESQTGFLAKTSSATLFNSIQAPGGGMEALSFTAAKYVQTGHSNGVPSATSADMFHQGSMYYDDGLGAEQIYNGSAWISITAGSGCSVSTAAGNVLFSTGSGCGGSDNLAFNTGLQKLTIAGIASTAAFDVTSGFIQTEGGIVTNVGSWNAFNTNTDGMVARGHVVEQNAANTLGGYINFVPITYSPNGGGTCHDQYGNVVNQPLPLPGISQWAVGTATSTFSSGSFSITLSVLPSGVGVESQIVGLGIPRGDYIVGVSGTTITLAVATNAPQTSATMTFFSNALWEWDAPSSSMPDNGSCGTSLPANTLYGMNTNGYYFARGGFATDLPYFNSIQSLYGGVLGRALFTADTFNQTSGIQCAVLGTCGGAYYNTGGSNGIPTPLIGDTFHGGAFYWDTSRNAQQIFNGSGWSTLCYTSGAAGRVLFDNNAGACGETSALNWTGSTFQVLGNATVSGSITVGSCTGCGGGSAVTGVFGSGNISASPSTGNVTVSITSTPTWTAQFVGGTTNCTASGATSCFQQSGGAFEIFANGNAQFQTMTSNNVVINSGGTANCNSTGGTACFQQASGTFVIFGNGNGQFQGLTANSFANTGWNFNAFGPGTWTASRYFVNSTEGHTGGSCSAWTEGLCTAP